MEITHLKKLVKKKPFWIVAALIAVIILFMRTGPDAVIELPKELHGEWVTAHPKYANRFIQFDRRLITISTSEKDFDLYAVLNVEKTDLKNGYLYNVAYREPPNLELTFSFFYDPSNGGVVRLKNQKNIEWKKRNT